VRAVARNFQILVPTCVDAKQKRTYLRLSIHDINFVDASVDVDMLSVSWGLRTADEFCRASWDIWGSQPSTMQCTTVVHKMCLKRHILALTHHCHLNYDVDNALIV
jgi:hypothetical protein